MKYFLVLNDMRSSNIENSKLVCAADTREELVAWIESQFHGEINPVTGERKGWRDDDRWSKAFKKGSPLEWFNRPSSPSVSDGMFSTIDESLPVFSLDSMGHGIMEVMDIHDFTQVLIVEAVKHAES